MLYGICDKRERIAARIFLALQSGCECCTFWRGVMLGFALATVTAYTVIGLVMFT